MLQLWVVLSVLRIVTSAIERPMLLKPTKLTVCTAKHFEPMIFRGKNSFAGYEVDILQVVAKDLGVTLDFKVVPFKQIWRAPTAKKCDVAAAAISITQERKKQGTLFTLPHYKLNQSLLVRTVNKEKLSDLSQFVGKKVGIIAHRLGGLNVRAKAPSGVIFVAFIDENALIEALRSGKIDGAAGGVPSNAHQAKIDPNLSMISIIPSDEQIAFSVADENVKLADAINRVVNVMKQDDSLAQLEVKWF
jgi:polar amino acid transport system substrate-binding protein